MFATCTLALLILGGCGITRRVAISSMVPLIEKTVEAIYRDQDIETVGKGMPGNLLLVRGMCESDPGNRELWAMGCQLYFYYGIGFVEEEDPGQAELVYAEGLALGQRWLSRKGWFRPDERMTLFRKGLEKAGRADAPILFWMLANWVSWINLRVNDPAALAQLPYAEGALERVLELDPTYFHGMPHVMLGTLQASKPVLIGGKPEQAQQQFEEAFAISGRKLLIFQVLYAQSYCRQTLDQEGFVQALEEVLRAPADLEPEYRLLNEVAKRKAARLMERKDDWF